MARPRVTPLCLRRSLDVQEVAGRRLLGVLRWSENGRHPVRLFFATGVERADFGPDPAPGDALRITAAWGVGRGVALFGEAPDGRGPLRLALRGRVAELAACAPEPEPFAGLDVGLATCNGEPAETVAEWIEWHVQSAGMTGALILDRRPPGPEADAFAEALEAQAAGIAGLKRLMILSSPVPLGLDAPPESHPISAPDAPGKDRMDVPANDPWTSPFGEPVIYELAKWRFLSQAAGVMNLESCEMLLPAPEGAPGVFQAARAAGCGVLALYGERAFPWRVREGERPRFADHICRRFDSHDVHRRWCVAPAQAGLENVWRAVRILNAAPDGAVARPFLRAMALRLPGRATAEIVPKTALVEDPALVAWAGTQGHKPVRQPQSPRPAKLPRAADAGYTAIVTTMKNEGPFILEWLAYHRAIGVEKFLVYTNDCSDGTDTLLDLLQSHGVVEHRDNPFRSLGLPPQHGALQAAEAEPVIQGSGWAICMDVDEFINIHVGDGRLADLYAAVGDANLISLTWRLFGNADIASFDPDLVIAQFTRCAPHLVRKPHQAWGFKTLFRNLQIYKKIGVHRPKGLKPDLWEQIRWVNGSGRSMPRAMLRNGWRSTTETYGYDLVTLNHYALRSAESFLVKRDRGRVNHVDRDQGLNYWFRMNFNVEEDRSIERMIPAARAELDRLLALAGVAERHEACVAAHRAKIAALRARPDQAEFFDLLTGERMRRLSRLHRHFGANVYLAGPDCVPDAVAFGDPAPDFFFTVPRPESLPEGH